MDRLASRVPGDRVATSSTCADDMRHSRHGTWARSCRMCWPVEADASDQHRGDLDWRELCRVQARESTVAPLTLILAMAATAAGKPRKIRPGLGCASALGRSPRCPAGGQHEPPDRPAAERVQARVAVRRAIGHIEASARQRRRLVVRGPHAELTALGPTPRPTSGRTAGGRRSSSPSSSLGRRSSSTMSSPSTTTTCIACGETTLPILMMTAPTSASPGPHPRTAHATSALILPRSSPCARPGGLYHGSRMACRGMGRAPRPDFVSGNANIHVVGHRSGRAAPPAS